MEKDILFEVETIFSSYPPSIRKKVLFLRELIYEVAKEENIQIEESLKWNIPSYSCKKGSPIRISWVENTKNKYSMYFICTTKLIETFRILFDDIFEFKGKREICFDLKDELPLKELKYCILLALSYQKRKHLHLLDSEDF